MKKRSEALGNAENEFGRATRKQDPTPSVTPKTSPGAQNMKMGPDVLGTAEKDSGRAKRENGTRRPQCYNLV
jgi:hypothetical protein